MSALSLETASVEAVTALQAIRCIDKAEDLKFIQRNLNKLIEVAEAIDSLSQNSTENDPALVRAAEESLSKAKLQGPERALLAAWLVGSSGESFFVSREVSAKLAEFDKSVANITATLNSLKSKEFIFFSTDDKGHHKITLTPKGISAAVDLARRRSRELQRS